MRTPKRRWPVRGLVLIAILACASVAGGATKTEGSSSWPSRPRGVLIAIVALVATAIGQDRPQAHDLYANRDGKAFSFERSFRSLAACDAAAKALYESKRVHGAGCKPTPTPAALAPNPDPNAEFGSRFGESQRDQREQKAQDTERRANRALEERKIRAPERGADAEERKARAVHGAALLPWLAAREAGRKAKAPRR